MVDFLFNYGWIIVVGTVAGVGFGGYIFYVFKKYGKEKALTELRESIYKAIIAAEKKFDIGEEKFDWVANKVYLLIPDSVKLFLSDETLEEFIQKCYDEAIDFLDDGELNDSNE